MKRVTVLLIACLLFSLAGCQSKAPVNPGAANSNGTPAVNLPEGAGQEVGAGSEAEGALDEVIEIREKMFVAQTNDIYYNAGEYLGRTIQYEGIFCEYTVPETGETYRSVIRYGPGCCGFDANCGFEVIWDEDYPRQDDWVEVTGVLEEYSEDGWQYLRLRLSSLTVLDERGAEYVVQ